LDGFLSIVSDASPDDYATFRALFQRYLPSRVTDTFAPAVIDQGGGPGSPGPSHDS